MAVPEGVGVGVGVLVGVGVREGSCVTSGSSPALLLILNKNWLATEVFNLISMFYQEQVY